LITDYLASIDELLAGLGAGGAPEWRAQRYRLALDIARVPEQIKGFGHVKARNLRAARLAWDGLLAQFRNPSLAQQAA
jgi:indolepyruvate ferredoxin oxidoreductase